jgi:hypothetical protein
VFLQNAEWNGPSVVFWFPIDHLFQALQRYPIIFVLLKHTNIMTKTYLIFLLSLSLGFSLVVKAGPTYQGPTKSFSDTQSTGTSPRTTTRPEETTKIPGADPELRKRDYYGDTCGYAEGNSCKQ